MMAPSDMHGKVALVTGASQGIGRACALALSAMGAHVGVAARSLSKLEDLAAEIRAARGSGDTLLRWYVLHVLMLPFVIVIFMAIHFWRVRKDGGISGPL